MHKFHSHTIRTVSELRIEAEKLLIGVPEGDPLDLVARSLVDLGVKAAVTCLDIESLDCALTEAFKAGASTAQVQETIALVSGLGVHSLMASSYRLLEKAKSIDKGLRAPLTIEQQTLWDKYIGDDPYWVGFEQEVPGFLDALLRLSPQLFRGFHEYCAIPWRSGTVPAVSKELIAMASDATPTHRFVPGMRLHMRNALKLGAGRRTILEALEIAAAAPEHSGVG